LLHTSVVISAFSPGKRVDWPSSFGELALHLPNTDLDLVMFGKNAAHSVERVQARGLTKSDRPCVFEYTGPASCGSGTVRILLDSDPGYYCPSRERSEHPDAIVALNAGLGSYISWQHVILRSAEFDIPFVVTDYSEACLSECATTALEQALTSKLPPAKGIEEIRFHARDLRLQSSIPSLISDFPGDFGECHRASTGAGC
jgi:hypothetical protein